MNNQDFKYRLCIFILSLAIFVYAGIKAHNLSITHDEAFTYTRYVSHSYKKIIKYETGNILPNNHILNTISQKFFSGLFGPSEFALRLGSLIACIVLLVTAYMFSKYFSGILMLAAFVLMVLHPYVLDFMVLARGYGIAFAFMMLSLYFLIESIKNGFDPKYFVFGSGAGIVSIWANFSLLNYFIPGSLLFLGLQWFFTKAQLRKIWVERIGMNITIFFVSCMMLVVTVYEPIRIIHQRKQLFGGEKGFWSDTVISLLDRLAYGAGYLNYWMLFLQMLIALVIIGSIAQIIFVFIKRKPASWDQVLIFLLLLILGIAAAVIFQHHFMGSFFPKERLALSLLPPFVLLMLVLVKSMELNSEKTIKLSRIPVLFIGSILLLHMINRINLTYVLDWKYDANTETIAHDIEALPGEVILGAHPLYEPALNFYRIRDGLTKYSEVDHDGYRKEGAYNYFVIADEDRDKISRDSLVLIKEYFPSKTLLAARR